MQIAHLPSAICMLVTLTLTLTRPSSAAIFAILVYPLR
jgi:hypothetical protein